MNYTSKTVGLEELKELEGALYVIDQLLRKKMELDPTDPKNYTYKSIGVNVFDNNYVREDLRDELQKLDL
ncbi:hypothetical protein [Fusibacter ferrireducens]|uniref:Uncharacterized protein n=1 Tax=Fusibacter ferrireducens TaxID=2785058 RepID=A0ABR9ZQC2_9FIRM|nr:hypothetical protein [Fusibacter ferrireducens]MBF4692651.1 hypothetical protein [Fusibacter ferrireducens]